MGYPFGIAPLADGTCTSPAEMQRLIGSYWGNPGVISGCEVTGRADMKWQVAAGAVVVQTGARLAVEVPVESLQVTSPAPPSTGTRRDYIYADTSGQVKISSASPSSGTVIASVIVPAGATATNQMGVEVAKRYALPVGASLGELAGWTDPAGGWTTVTDTSEQVRWNYVLPILPTDRQLEFRITQCLATQAGDGVENRRGSCVHLIKLDGVQVARIELEYTNVWEPKQVFHQMDVSGGAAHTVTYSNFKYWGSTAYHFRAGVAEGFSVWDRGAVQ